MPTLAETRTVYALELEGRGRTRDLDRPLPLRQFANDVAGFIAQRALRSVHPFGFGLKGGRWKPQSGVGGPARCASLHIQNDQGETSAAAG